MFDMEWAVRKLMAASTQRKNCQSLGMCLSARNMERSQSRFCKSFNQRQQISQKTIMVKKKNEEENSKELSRAAMLAICLLR